MYALVDCNNFYCSCERLFDPKLKGRPVIVLSNNDGCAISRSDEARALGIEMGTPAFLVADVISRHNVAVLSSNYTLYGDMSDRVMKTLAQFCSGLEIYSIDEAFLDLNRMGWHDLRKLGENMRWVVERDTGIPITVGIAPTKTLAKMANRHAKRDRNGSGVWIACSAADIDGMLRATAVEDIWGIGRRYAVLLKTNGINTAYDFVQVPEEWVRKKMSVVGQRLRSELKGVATEGVQPLPAPKKNIAISRSFGKLLQSKADIAEALSNYAALCALKLRQQKSCCTAVNVFLQTNPMRTDHPQYKRSVNVTLELATNNTSAVIKAGLQALDIIYLPGYQYLKTGITVSDLVPESVVQHSVFSRHGQENNKRTMAAMDLINECFGKDTLRMATQGFEKTFRRRAAYLSPCYTTNINDILKVNN